MTNLTPIQEQIVEALPATSAELALQLYGRATKAERRLIYVHIHHLRQRAGEDAILSVTNGRRRGMRYEIGPGLDNPNTI